MSDGLNTAGPLVHQPDADRQPHVRHGNGSGTCANIKAAGITIYSIQVNTGGDPTSTLMQNCASSSDKFWLVTSAKRHRDACSTRSAPI